MSKKLALTLLCLITYFAFGFQNPKSSKWVISKNCSLKVAGSTNINKFNCDIANYYKPDTLNIYQSSGNHPVKISGKMELEISQFDCHNPVMTADLRKTLKAKTYPTLTINFVSLDRYPDFKNANGELKGKVNIALAGVNKAFEVNYRYNKTAADAIALVGTQRVNFSDFKIIPPRKLGGMIETNDELDIQFVLQLKIIN